LYKFLNEEQRAGYDKLRKEDWDLDFFKDKIANFDNILARLYMDWQNEYLKNFQEDSEW
jgi:hypothetical protein